MIGPYGGQPPARRPGSTMQGDIKSLQARGKGTLSEFVSAKSNPQDIRTDRSPMLSQGENPSDVTSGANVNRGSGLVRDAETKAASARQLLRERIADLRV